MRVFILDHAKERLSERGATVAEVEKTILTGKKRPAKHGRIEYRKVFDFDGVWLGKRYRKKRVDAFAKTMASGNCLVVTIIVKYF